jgi:hypothetical protein
LSLLVGPAGLGDASPDRADPGPEGEDKVQDGLYAAGAPQLLERMRRVPESVPSVMIPPSRNFSVQLVGDEAARIRLTSKFPTAALATRSVGALRWPQLRAGAELVAFLTPRNA